MINQDVSFLDHHGICAFFLVFFHLKEDYKDMFLDYGVKPYPQIKVGSQMTLKDIVRYCSFQTFVEGNVVGGNIDTN